MRFSLLALVLLLAACESEPAPPVSPEAPVAPAAPEAAAPAVALINLNTATEEQFRTVPGVGDRMVHEFDEYRPWTSVEQFRREIGKYIDDDAAILDGYLAYVFVPVDVNESDAATMMQLPGVGDEEVSTLTGGRPFASPEAFMEAYMAAVPAGDADAARAMLTSE